MATSTLAIGSKLPDFNLKATDGNYYSADSFKEVKILIVVFGCNHCPYVIANENRLISIQNDYQQNVRMVEINSNDSVRYPDDSFENMIKRAEEKKFNFPYLRDEDQSAAKSFGATHTPEIFVFDKNRRLAYHGKIDDNWQEPESVKSHYLRDALDELIAGQEVSLPETYSIGCTIKWK